MTHNPGEAAPNMNGDISPVENEWSILSDMANETAPVERPNVVEGFLSSRGLAISPNTENVAESSYEGATSEFDTTETPDNNETEDGAEEEKNLAERIDDAQKLVTEVENTEDELYDMIPLAINFGLDGLSRRYGLEKVLSVVGQETAKMNATMRAPRRGFGRWRSELRFVEDAITNIYNSIEPDSDKRRELYSEMTTIKDESQEDVSQEDVADDGKVRIDDLSDNSKRNMEFCVHPDKNGDIKTYSSGASGTLNEAIALDGLRSIEWLMEDLSNPDSPLFGDVVKEAEQSNQSVVTKLTEGIEHPGLLDFMKRVYDRVKSGAAVASEQIDSQKAEIEATVSEMEEKARTSVGNEVKPIEEYRSEMETRMATIEDETARATLKEASEKLKELMYEKTKQAAQKFKQERTAYYASFGEGTEGFLVHKGKRMKDLADSFSFYDRKFF